MREVSVISVSALIEPLKAHLQVRFLLFVIRLFNREYRARPSRRRQQSMSSLSFMQTHTETDITKLLLALQERTNAIGFLAIVRFPGIRTNWIAAQLAS